MDHLTLLSVAASLDRQLRGAVLRGVAQEGQERFRLILEIEASVRTVVLSLRPGMPWMARPHGPRFDPERSESPFAAACRRELVGAFVERIERSGPGRLVVWRFSGGGSLVAELAENGANLILIDPAGAVVASARRPRRARERLEPSRPYKPPEVPRHRLSALFAGAGEVDRELEAGLSEGASLERVLRRRLFGVGPATAELLIRDAPRSEVSIGALLVERVRELGEGQRGPVIEASFDPRKGAGLADPDSGVIRLLPWEPIEGPVTGLTRYRGETPDETAGWFHEALDRRARQTGDHARRLEIVRRELSRSSQALARATADADRFEDPDRHRIHGEALLAGATRARREGGAFAVPDPYASDGSELRVPAAPGLNPHQAAEQCFRRHKRARRGVERTQARMGELRSRAGRLRSLLDTLEQGGAAADPTPVEEGLRELGLAVGLEHRARGKRSRAPSTPPRLEGVRVYAASDGSSILVGKTGRDNHRLTFKIAGPEDFWFHVQGRAGAHVIVRNETGARRPSRETLQEAAAVAAWYSGSKGEGRVDVQWTRRKYVRRPRGAPAGTVVLKRYETVSVRPGIPAAAGTP